jgi:hypothetical protein
VPTRTNQDQRDAIAAAVTARPYTLGADRADGRHRRAGQRLAASRSAAPGRPVLDRSLAIRSQSTADTRLPVFHGCRRPKDIDRRIARDGLADGYGVAMNLGAGVLTLAACLLAGCGGDEDKASETQGGGREGASRSEGPPPVIEGAVGDALKTTDTYESNGQPVEERLSVAVLSVDDPAKPNNAFLADALAKKGHRWIRVRVRVEQNGSTSTRVLTHQFTAASSAGETFGAAATSVFEPSIAPSSNSIELDPGRTRTGFIAIQATEGTQITAIEFRDGGFGPAPDTARWTLRK